MSVTDEDRERAVSLVPDHQHWCQVVGHGDCCARDASDCDCGVQESRDAVAEALADERERALRPVLELAATLDDEAQSRWVRVLQARQTGERDAQYGERGAGDALHDAAVRICLAVADVAGRHQSPQEGRTGSLGHTERSSQTTGRPEGAEGGTGTG